MKKIISMIMIVTLMMVFSVNAFAAENTSTYSTLHKTNGVGMENGGKATYTTTTTRECTIIKVRGTCDVTVNNWVTIRVYNPDFSDTVPVASGSVRLDGNYYTIAQNTSFPAKTYTVEVDPAFSGGYDVATFFYY